MGMSKCYSLMKCLLILLNIVFLCVGVLVCAFAVWALCEGVGGGGGGVVGGGAHATAARRAAGPAAAHHAARVRTADHGHADRRLHTAGAGVLRRGRRSRLADVGVVARAAGRRGGGRRAGRRPRAPRRARRHPRPERGSPRALLLRARLLLCELGRDGVFAGGACAGRVVVGRGAAARGVRGACTRHAGARRAPAAHRVRRAAGRARRGAAADPRAVPACAAPPPVQGVSVPRPPPPAPPRRRLEHVRLIDRADVTTHRTYYSCNPRRLVVHMHGALVCVPAGAD